MKTVDVEFERYDIDNIRNQIINGDSLDVLSKLPSNSIDMVITSPPYWGLRDYGVEDQLGCEGDFEQYLEKLIEIFNEVYRVLKDCGTCWVNISDTFATKNVLNVPKKSVCGIPDRFKIRMVDSGWLCRNEVIWHKPNAIPSSAKDRFNVDYEKIFLFTKQQKYHFETQYEEATTKKVVTSKNNKKHEKNSKYKDESQEKSVRQGMSKSRGFNIIEKRPLLPSQEAFVSFLRERTSIKHICENVDIKRTKVEHWFRRDVSGFAYPSVDDWSLFKHLVDDSSEEYKQMDKCLSHIVYETDDINKNIHKGRLKRSVWSINTKPFKGCHFAPYPEELMKTPIKAGCPINGVVLDPFMGSGTTGLVAKELNRDYIGIELNKEYIDIANDRISKIKT